MKELTVQARIRSALLLALADVAALSQVQRPVVSAWRSRSAGTSTPFPAAVSFEHGQERFDAHEVTAWLEATGRGNNPDARADAAAFALPAGVDISDHVTFDALTALLCLRAMTGQPLDCSVATDLVELADELDPDDEMLLREVESATDRLRELSDYADQLSDAAFGPAAALERLVAARSRRAPSTHAADALARPVHDLVAALTVALSRDLAAEPATYVDCTPGGCELLFSVLRGPEVDSAPTVLTPDHDSPAARLVRRRLRTHGVHREGVVVDVDGSFAVSGPVVHVAQYPSPGRNGASTADVLAEIDQLQLQMDDQQRAVVLAPAAMLCDRLADRLDDHRDELLRLGRVRAVIRLPRGLVTTSPRQQLGLWVLGPAHERVSLDERWTSVADLSDVVLSDGVIDDLVSDLVAVMGDRTSVRSHAFRFARVLPTRHLVTGRRALVTPGAQARRPGHVPAPQQALTIDGLRTALASSVGDPLARVSVTVTDGEQVDFRITWGLALAQRLVRVVPGARIEPAHLLSGSVQVVGVDELTGRTPIGARGIDPLALAATYPAARRTEPGDVVFCTSPRPRAVVDTAGGSVAVFPARVLRIRAAGRTAGLTAPVVVAGLNELPDDARAWRSWPAQRVPSAQLEALDAALTDLAREEAAARARSSRLNDLSRLLVQGVASGSLTLAVSDLHTSSTMEG